MDLEVAPVDAVVVGDDQAGELHVLVLERLQRAVERLHHHVQSLERLLLEVAQLVLEAGPGLGHQPNFPVTYSSVRASCGVVNSFSVGLCSTSSPLSMNAVESETRAACCMLCVTITIV